MNGLGEKAPGNKGAGRIRSSQLAGAGIRDENEEESQALSQACSPSKLGFRGPTPVKLAPEGDGLSEGHLARLVAELSSCFCGLNEPPSKAISLSLFLLSSCSPGQK